MAQKGPNGQQYRIFFRIRIVLKEKQKKNQTWVINFY